MFIINDNDDSNSQESDLVTNNEISDIKYILSEKKGIKWHHRPISILDSYSEWEQHIEDQELLSPSTYFSKCIPDDLFCTVADMTNIYALQSGGPVMIRSRNSSPSSWYHCRNVSADSMRFVLCSGVSCFDTRLEHKLFVASPGKHVTIGFLFIYFLSSFLASI
jgi:hypothetical protein